MSILSTTDLPDGSRIDTDICVIGAGAAGLTLAREFAGSQARVCVLESGGLSMATDPDPMLRLASSEPPTTPASRARGLGGTTALWSGKWKPMDDIDFSQRDWLDVPGWPITRRILDVYYERAARQAGITAGDDTPATSRFADASITPVRFAAQDEPLRHWGKRNRRVLRASENVQVVLDAHVTALESTPRRVERVRTASGITITARQFVLAAGGIENARMLLIAGLGNAHDQVGRYFMDHPKAKFGTVATYDPLEPEDWRSLHAVGSSWLGLRLSDAAQREARVLDAYVALKPVFQSGLPRRWARKLKPARQCRLLSLNNYLEQAPRADNRVSLSAQLDPHGLPYASLAWTLSELEQHSLRVLHRHLAAALQRNRIGELHSPLLRTHLPFPAVGDAAHHMGTTRMGADPRSSVVDADCRLHGVDNLYLAGPSVFATSGYANPMATIAALAIRLAEHLKDRL